jgi:hypothetical protein
MKMQLYLSDTGKCDRLKIIWFLVWATLFLASYCISNFKKKNSKLGEFFYLYEHTYGLL